MYERFFGLADAPFRLTPDPRYLFLSRKHADALAHLRLGLAESSGFVCITGDVGTGKTTVLRHFLLELGPEVRTAYIVNPTLSPLELLQTVNAELGLPAESGSRKVLIDQLNTHLLSERAAGRRAVVVVDEAQALSVEVLEHLRLLSNLETTTEKLLRIILVGQPQLRALLLHPELVQLNQRITLRWHIGPLEADETASYVCHRLAVASGGGQVNLFTAGALRDVHRYAGGIPRLVNMLAHRALLAAFAAEEHRVTRRTVRRAYREVATVPLPLARPASSRWRSATLALAAAAALGGVAVGAWRWLPALRAIGAPAALAPVADTQLASARLPVDPGPSPAPVAESAPAAPAPQAAEAGAPPAAAPVDERADALGARAAQPAEAAPPAAAAESPPAGATEGTASAPPTDDAIAAGGSGEASQPAASPPPAATPESAAPADANAAAPTAAPAPKADATPADAQVAARDTDPPPAAEPAAASEPTTLESAAAALESALAKLDERTSARAALETVLRAWQLGAPAANEPASPDDYQRLAERRGLEHLALAGNTPMLRLLDVPAVLELQLPGASGPRYVALLGLREGVPVLVAGDGEAVAVSPTLLDRTWFGQAHVFWRDFEGLGPGPLEADARGGRVARLQALLHRAGVYGGPESGVFDAATTQAVLGFQRSRYVAADGIVGPLTRVVLYAAAGGFPRPTLAAEARPHGDEAGQKTLREETRS